MVKALACELSVLILLVNVNRYLAPVLSPPTYTGRGKQLEPYMHTCIHAYMHTCIHAYMHTCIQERLIDLFSFGTMMVLACSFWRSGVIGLFGSYARS